jgi:hypothetical protein
MANATTSGGTEPDAPSQSAVFAAELEPVEGEARLVFLTDRKTGAVFCECHIRGSKLVELATVDVPLDPEEQAEYRANREIVESSYAFQKMKEDAKGGRSFSNIVAEYTREFDPDHPIKIIGGQHRFAAIEEAVAGGIDEYHGVKLYVGLNKDQRLDVQLISNTNISISGDLYDRMQETVRGPQLRNWCQKVGLLDQGEDFADKRERGGPISVQVARVFITNYFRGKSVDPLKFDLTDTTPVMCPSGQSDSEWEALREKHPDFWKDAELLRAGSEFARLVAAQRAAFVPKKPRTPPDFPEKAMNLAVVAAWGFVAGMVSGNEVRLTRHFSLADAAGRDPLNAAALLKGRHKTDPENYRGLGYRTDAKERGRFVELFADQAEDGGGITPGRIDVAIKKYHAKQAQLDVIKAQDKATV